MVEFKRHVLINNRIRLLQVRFGYFSDFNKALVLETESFFYSFVKVIFCLRERDGELHTCEEFIWDHPIERVRSALVHLNLVFWPISQKWDHCNSLSLINFYSQFTWIKIELKNS